MMINETMTKMASCNIQGCKENESEDTAEDQIIVIVNVGISNSYVLSSFPPQSIMLTLLVLP